MATTFVRDKVTITKNGAISLPEYVRQMAGLEPGDELIVAWLPPDTIMVRKLSGVAADDEAFVAEMREFDEALRAAGYETDEDIVRLVREVKAEQAAEYAAEQQARG